MTNKEKRRFAIARLGELKDATIVLDLETMDLEDDLALYDSMFHCFARGDLDNQFESVVFDGMSEDERVRLIDLVKNYRGLCFYNGKGEYWLDSLEGFAVSDNEIIAYSILDNYDYLLALGKKGGKRVLDQLQAFQNSGYINSSVVEYLRRSNISDELLETILLDMAREDSLYNMFTAEQKALLLGNPYGNLFTFTDDGVVIKSPVKLAKDLYTKIMGEDVALDRSNAEFMFRGLWDFLSTADIDNIVISDSDNYIVNAYEKNYPTEIKTIEFDDSYDFLRESARDIAPSYDSDEDIKRM